MGPGGLEGVLVTFERQLQYVAGRAELRGRGLLFAPQSRISPGRPRRAPDDADACLDGVLPEWSCCVGQCRPCIGTATDRSFGALYSVDRPLMIQWRISTTSSSLSCICALVLISRMQRSHDSASSRAEAPGLGRDPA
jgi:hypothetical protein